jgi:hypothetical protein
MLSRFRSIARSVLQVTPRAQHRRHPRRCALNQVSAFATNAGSLSTARFQLQATRLAGAGRILVSGGFTAGSTGSTALDLFDVTGTSFTAVTPIDALTTARGGHVATLLFGGTALIVGGTAATTLGELFSSGQ